MHHWTEMVRPFGDVSGGRKDACLHCYLHRLKEEAWNSIAQTFIFYVPSCKKERIDKSSTPSVRGKWRRHGNNIIFLFWYASGAWNSAGEKARVEGYWKESWNCFVLPFFWSLSFPSKDKMVGLRISDNGLNRKHTPLQPHDAEHMLHEAQSITNGSRRYCPAYLTKMLYLHHLIR